MFLRIRQEKGVPQSNLQVNCVVKFIRKTNSLLQIRIGSGAKLC